MKCYLVSPDYFSDINLLNVFGEKQLIEEACYQYKNNFNKSIRFSELLSLMEFTYKINNDGTLSLVDRTGANLNGIINDKFTLNNSIGMSVVERLHNYIEDYILSDIREEYKYLTSEDIDKNSSLDEYISKIKGNFELGYDELVLECIKDPNLIDISELPIEDDGEPNTVEKAIKFLKDNEYEIIEYSIY